MRKLALFSGGFCGAILAAAAGLPLRAAMVCAVLAAAAVCLLLRFRGRAGCKRCLIALLGVCVGFLWAAGYWLWQIRPLEAFDGGDLFLAAEARQPSRQTAFGTSTAVEVELDGRMYSVLLYGEAGLDLSPGDWAAGLMQLQMSGGVLGGANAADGARGYDLTAELLETPRVYRAGRTPLRHWPAAFSQEVRRQLSRLLPEPERGYAAALVSGDTSGLSETFLGELNRSGTRHVVAVSGMHIGILLGAFLLLLGNRRRLAALLGLPLIWFFSLAVGMTPSVVRAAVMQSCLLLAPVARRENDPPTSLLTALMLILLPNPRAILDVGLQLSFASAAGILLFSKGLFARMWSARWIRAAAGRAGWLSGCLRAALSGVAASVSVLPLTMPLSLLYFDTVSLAAPLSSLLILPVIPACFTLSLLSALLGMLFLPLGLAAAWPLVWLLRYCMAVTGWAAELPFASVSMQGVYMAVFLAGLYGVVLCLLVPGRRCSALLGGGCLAGLFSLCLLLSSAEYDRARISVTMLDVGQGQCVYVESAGVSAMYDCGGEGDPATTAALFLQNLGRPGLDILVLSHYDEDHAGGAAALLDAVPVGTLFLPEQAGGSDVQAEILAAAARSGCQVCFVTSDLRLTLGNAEVRLFAPAEEAVGNNACVAAYWSSGGFSVLMTGDMDAASEKALVSGRGLEKANVLIAGHHGAADSTGAAILQILKPEIVLISADGGGSYGHPAAETLGRLAEAGAAVYRTDLSGNITVRR